MLQIYAYALYSLYAHFRFPVWRFRNCSVLYSLYILFNFFIFMCVCVLGCLADDGDDDDDDDDWPLIILAPNGIINCVLHKQHHH